MSFRLIDQASDQSRDARLVHVLTPATAKDRLAAATPLVQGAAAASGFKAEADQSLLVPGADGAIATAWLVTGERAAAEPEWGLAALADSLPEGVWRLADADPAAATAQALGWALGTYAYSRYRPAKGKGSAQLVWPEGADKALVLGLAGGTCRARDLITTPAADMGPGDLASAARSLAEVYGAEVSVVIGDQLLAENFPAVHAVGRASARPPCLIDLSWGDAAHPKVTLVGKGVCFDSGGYDIKPSAGMKLMKKDMGGAATVLGLAEAVMATGLKVRLRVLVPAVENLIDGNAFKPMDVLRTRKGLTVEVGNTDAEGRLILCDALTEAVSEEPALLIDCATLTGAARVALGPDLPVMFTRHDDLAQRLAEHGTAAGDPLWRLPLWAPYRKMLDTRIADLSSTGDSPFAGAITAALFLAEFVPSQQRWVHIDMMAWFQKSRPGRPEGGEPQALRALWRLIQEHEAA